jgi:hypothetical protein
MQNCEKMNMKNKTKDQISLIPIGKLRFVPKRNSLRPLMTFFKKFLNKKSSRLEKIARYLQPVKIVLRSVKKLLSGNWKARLIFRNEGIQCIRQLPDLQQILQIPGRMEGKGETQIICGHNGYQEVL